VSKHTVRFDQAVAEELGLELSTIVIIIKHASQFPDKVTQFVFAYEQNGLIYYDIADTWHEVNGRRVRNPRFRSHKVIEDKLNKRQYYRWYVVGNGILFPVQQSTVENLRLLFSFLIDDDPRYRTQTAFFGETQFIRKKPLVNCRPAKQAWDFGSSLCQKQSASSKKHAS